MCLSAAMKSHTGCSRGGSISLITTVQFIQLIEYPVLPESHDLINVHITPSNIGLDLILGQYFIIVKNS